MKLTYRLLAGVLSGVLFLTTGGMTAFATDPAEVSSGETDAVDQNLSSMPTGAAATEEELEQQMEQQRQIVPESNAYESWPQGPLVTADSAIVMDINSGAVLYGKQIDKKQYPASITKVMTALLALENGDIHTDRVTFSEDSISFLEYGDAHIGMRPGEEISLEDAMYGMLLASANEVSYAISENIGNKMGIGYDGFIARMTERAKELGCENTNFVNANGLHDDQHYVSARDMALIGSEAFKHEEFRTVIGALEYRIPATNLVNEERVFQQNHKMIFEGNQYYYEYCVGGKTGYTDQARTTLITYAEKDGMQLVCVVLRTRGGVAYEDTKALFDYAFGNFQTVSLKTAETSEDFSEIPKTASVVLPGGASFADLKKTITQKEANSKEAAVEYTFNGTPVGTAEVVLSDQYLEAQKKEAEVKAGAEKAKAAGKSGIPMWLRVVLGVVLAAVLVCAIVLYLAVQNRKRRRRRRMQMRRQQARRRAELEAQRRDAQRREQRRGRYQYPAKRGGKNGPTRIS